MNSYLSALGIVNALGAGGPDVLERLLAGDQAGMHATEPLLTGRSGIVGRVDAELPEIPAALAEFDCRNNRLLAAAVSQIGNEVEALKSRYGPAGIGVVVGTSTSGIAEGETAIDALLRKGQMPAGFHYRQQEIGTAAEYLARHLGIEGPRYTVSTACSSSGKAVVSGHRLLAANLCDAVIVGGSDSLCQLTVNGFDGLESMSAQICNPFSAHRDGINIGEGAALFILSHEESAVQLLGSGESSDGYHMSAPEPAGHGAELAIRAALADAGVVPADIGYINLHGTATRKNDAMESRVVERIFGPAMPCSSTKSQIGHTLGAAGAQELGFCWLLLSDMNRDKRLPEHLWDGVMDPGLATIGLTGADATWERPVFMSNSFAFGGSNVSLVIGRR